MFSSNLADISFFSGITDSASRSFVWNGAQDSVIVVTNKNALNPFTFLSKKYRGEATVDPLKSGSAAELRENSLKAGKNKIWKSAITTALLPLLWMGSTGFESLASKTMMPKEYNRITAEQTLGENLFHHLIWNDLYQICVNDRAWLRVLEWVRRAAESGVGGNALIGLLTSVAAHRKNQKNAKLEQQHYSVVPDEITSEEYNLAADLKDQWEKEKADMQNNHIQETLTLQKRIEQLQEQLEALQKEKSFRG